MMRPEAVECKLIGKLEPQLLTKHHINSNSKGGKLYDLKAIKGSLVAYTYQGIFEIFNITNVNDVLT